MNRGFEETAATIDTKTKSIENTLIPLVRQLSALIRLESSGGGDGATVNRLRSKAPPTSIRATIAESVYGAIERFVKVGLSIVVSSSSKKKESILRSDMEESCKLAQLAGEALLKVTFFDDGGGDETSRPNEVREICKTLLTHITRVLVVADVLVVCEVVECIDKVARTLDQLSQSRTHSDLAQRFTQYGSDMVAVAHCTGDRQADLKEDRKKAILSSARTILEKFTLLVLLTTKCHINAEHQISHKTRSIKDLIYGEVEKNLKKARRIVVESAASSSSCITTNNSQNNRLTSGKQQSTECIDKENLCKLCKDIEAFLVSNMESTAVEEVEWGDVSRSIESICQKSSQFLDASFVSHEQRERISQYICQLRKQMVDTSSLKKAAKSSYETLVQKLRASVHQLLAQATELFRTTDEISLLNEVRNYGLMKRKDMLELCLQRFCEQHESVCELCRLMEQISPCEPLTIACQHHEAMFHCLFVAICESARLLAFFSWPPQGSAVGNKMSAYCTLATKTSAHNTSATSQLELFDNLFRYWIDEINDFSVLVKELQDVIEQRTEKLTYFSLPRPGRHGTTTRNCSQATNNSTDATIANTSPTPSRRRRHPYILPQLDSDEKTRMLLELGVAMRAATNEVDLEAERWDDAHHNEIIRRAKNMSSMTFSMYQFTRNEGSIHCAQDLFVQASYLIEESIRLHNAIDRFAFGIPDETFRRQLEQQLDVLSVLSHQLQLRIRLVDVSERRNELLSKIDNVIKETGDIMKCVARLISTAFLCYNKFNMSGAMRDSERLSSSQLSEGSRYRQTRDKINPAIERAYDSNDETSSSCVLNLMLDNGRHLKQYKKKQQSDCQRLRYASEETSERRRNNMIDKYLPVYSYKTDRV